MSGGVSQYEVRPLVEPLELLLDWTMKPELVVWVGGAALVGTLSVWLLKRARGGRGALSLWPVPLAVGLLFVAPASIALGHGHVGLGGALTACSGLPLFTLALIGFVRARGRQLSRAGWLLLPTLTLALVAVFQGIELPFQPPRWSHDAYLGNGIGRFYWGGTLLLADGLLVAGTVMAACSFAPSAARQGHSRFLATRGSLLVCFAGVAECHRVIMTAWYFNDFQQASDLWALRNALLWAAVGIATASMALGWRSIRRARPRRTAVVLSIAQLIFLGLCFCLLEVSAAATYGTAGLVRTEPVCPRHTCSRDGRGSVAVYSETGPRYLVFLPDVGVIDARFEARAPTLTSRRTSPSPSTP